MHSGIKLLLHERSYIVTISTDKGRDYIENYYEWVDTFIILKVC